MVKAIDDHFVYKFDKSNVVLIMLPPSDKCMVGEWFDFIGGKMVDLPGVERCVQLSGCIDHELQY